MNLQSSHLSELHLEELTPEQRTELYNKISDRNFGILSAEDQERIRNGRIVIIGQGCVGELATMVAARIGIGSITIVDQDNLAWSNFNRNPLARAKYVGKPKVDNVIEIIRESNPTIRISGFKEMLGEENAERILPGHDIILNLIDNMVARVVVHRAARRLDLPCITMSGAPKHRAIVSTFLPGGIDYETAFGLPTKRMTLDESAKKTVNALKKDRARYAMEHGADPVWARLYISGEREYWAVTPMRTYPTSVFAVQEAVNYLTCGAEGLIAKAPDARIYDLDGIVFKDLGVNHPEGVRIIEAVVRNVLKAENKIYQKF
jgi:molybdopterin-synthase adenylyltransferase